MVMVVDMFRGYVDNDDDDNGNLFMILMIIITNLITTTYTYPCRIPSHIYPTSIPTATQQPSHNARFMQRYNGHLPAV